MEWLRKNDGASGGDGTVLRGIHTNAFSVQHTSSPTFFETLLIANAGNVSVTLPAGEALFYQAAASVARSVVT